MLRSSSKDRGAGSSSASSGMYMNKKQMGDYLHDLRNNRPTRPAGARPPPPSSFVSKRYSTSNLSTAQGSTAVDHLKKEASDVPPRCSSAQSFHRRPAAASILDTATAGRPLARPPVEMPMEEEEIPEGEDELPYFERNQRWLERQEAHSLRRALEDMDIKKQKKQSADGVDKKLFDSAQDEAAELVWKHQNPNAPFRNPDAPYTNPDTIKTAFGSSYKEHLRKGSTHARTTSWAQTAQDIQARQMKRRSRESSSSRSASGGSKSSSAPSSRIPSDGSLKIPESPVTPLEEEVEAAESERESRKRIVQFSEPTNESVHVVPDQARGLRKMIRSISPSKALQDLKSKAKDQLVSGEGNKTTETTPSSHVNVSSGAVAARMASSAVPGHFRNPFSRARESKGQLSRVSTEQAPPVKPLDRFEIQRNPPSQSRNGFYTTNVIESDAKPPVPDIDVPMKDGKEIRSDELRKATSASLRDRSPKLPTPSMVSDSPGRPIVSFQKDWKPKEVEMKQEISSVQSKDPVPPPTLPKAYPLTNRDKHPPILRKNVPKTSESSMQVPSRERERTSPPPVPLVHAASEPIIPTASFGSMPIPTIAVSSAPPISVIAKNDAQPLPRIVVGDDLPPALRTGVNPGGRAPTNAMNSRRPLPAIAVNNGQSIPTIAVNSDNRIPIIAINDTPPAPSIAVSAPTISISEAPARGAPARLLPTPGQGRPGPRHAATAPPGSTMLQKSHITPMGYAQARGTGALCSMCALPISGRIVTAAGVRFHPECFRCHHCGEGLECVAFYPEPDSHRLDRVNRIRDRMAGYEDVPGSVEQDGDESLRFYCHLDYHEFFSPRCKSCKTPIEGEVVIACGAEWHVGHFFCAQCGDPFDDKTPFVEKDGYAWCVNCHTHRYSTKCKKCRKPVTETVVRALDAEWHEQCFCCTECNGRFEDGRFFIRPGGVDPFCPACEEKRLKA